MASEKPFKPLEEFTEGKIGGFALIEQAKDNPDILVRIKRYGSKTAKNIF